MSDRYILRDWDQHAGQIEAVSHDFASFASLHDTTLVSAAAQNVGLGMTVINEAVAGTLWSAQLNTPTAGTYYYELQGTFADGQVQVLEFQVEVWDLP